MSILKKIEDKWYRKAIAGLKANWIKNVKAASTFSAFCEGISTVTGIPASTVRASLPAKNFKDFQAHAKDYLPIILKKIQAAHKSGKWSTNYKKAFGAKPKAKPKKKPKAKAKSKAKPKAKPKAKKKAKPKAKKKAKPKAKKKAKKKKKK